MNTPVKLEELLDRMIDLADSRDLIAAYVILAGTNPTVGADWMAGKKIYRWFPVAQSRLIPDNLLVLAPAPDNKRFGGMREFHGSLDTGQIVEHQVAPDTPTAA